MLEAEPLTRGASTAEQEVGVGAGPKRRMRMDVQIDGQGDSCTSMNRVTVATVPHLRVYISLFNL